ncbi:histone deacetylase family protein [Thiomicrorhabdus sp. ZW0627]|uniref:histone deacetylase family protein n=1 Tax=Thiomicrorhabdus sp. ZW0627 TaxID=3039774 RepID=UPI002436D527|nr:histone deacetylase family protein [Thiomicrorhabdus sp. ZW0627]MDG6773721.1 histone deacetylase family protein [Thiomicrorhabdus sp. ZW0627]
MNLYITHSLCRLHDNGVYHPEMPERIGRIQDQLISTQLFDWFLHAQSRAATDEELALVHDPRLAPKLEEALPEEGVRQIGEDVYLSPDSMVAARHAAGAVLDGIDAVENGKAKRVFCNVRPPGHHAEYNEPKGFCLFNNVAIGAAYALQKYGYERVAIVDFDVHHGNGTESYVRREPRVWFGSSFEHPLYPYSDPVSDLPNMVKIPLAKFSDSDVFREHWLTHGFPALKAFKPQLILVSAGFDGHFLDPLANLRLHENDYRWITGEIVAIADEFAEGKVVSVLEGGYDLAALSMSAAEHIKELFGLNG